MKFLFGLLIITVCFLILILYSSNLPLASTLWIVDLLEFIPVLVYMLTALSLFLFGFYFGRKIEQSINYREKKK